MQQERSVQGPLDEDTSKAVEHYTTIVFLLENIEKVFQTKRLADANHLAVLSVHSCTTLRPLIEMGDEMSAHITQTGHKKLALHVKANV